MGCKIRYIKTYRKEILMENVKSLLFVAVTLPRLNKKYVYASCHLPVNTERLSRTKLKRLTGAEMNICDE